MQTGAISVFGAMEMGMALPKAIQAQVDAADAFYEQQNAAPAPADTPAVTEPEHVQQAPSAAVPEVVTPQPQHDEWKSRFDTLRGKYDAEVPRLSQQVRELNQAMQTLVAENERLKSETATAKTNLVTDADKEAFGSDLVDLIDRATKQATAQFERELAQMKAEKAELERRLGGVGEELTVSAQDRFQTKLTQLVPNWMTINTDHNFLVWCGQVDPVFGVPRQAALDAAAERLDANAAAGVFMAFLNTAAKPAKSPKDELQSQVAPNRSRTAVAPVADEGQNKVWSEAEIRQFYTDVRRNQYTQAEADRIENQINQAVAEGRVR